jgi:hypothetical protein
MVRGGVVQHDGKVFYQLSFTNQSQQALGGIAIQVPSMLCKHAIPLLEHVRLRGSYDPCDILHT